VAINKNIRLKKHTPHTYTRSQREQQNINSAGECAAWINKKLIAAAATPGEQTDTVQGIVEHESREHFPFSKTQN
jgi:hypothetical protein